MRFDPESQPDGPVQEFFSGDRVYYGHDLATITGAVRWSNTAWYYYIILDDGTFREKLGLWLRKSEDGPYRS